MFILQNLANTENQLKTVKSNRKKVIVTAGGMSVPIDAVRAITNKSTGQLSSLIADEFVNNGYQVDYICTATCEQPKQKVQVYQINTVHELLECFQKLLLQNEYFAVVHAMAVADYEVERIEPEFNGFKLPSDVECLTVYFKPTVKAINQIKQLQPQVKLVGFKLMSSACIDELTQTAVALCQRSQAEFIVANRLEDITSTEHCAYFVNSSSAFAVATTKHDISQEIVKQLECSK